MKNLLCLLVIAVLVTSCGGGGDTMDKSDVIANYVLKTTAEKEYEAQYQAGFEQGVLETNLLDPEYKAGYEQGLALGQEHGEQIGYDEGYTNGNTEGYNAGFEEGYNAAFNSGYADGFDQGYGDGSVADYNAGYNDGYNDGYNTGDSHGYNDGYDDGYDDGNYNGYNNGYDDGNDDGYFEGYYDGHGDGWDEGYDEGFDDGYYFEERTVIVKDLEKMGAKLEQRKVARLEDKLAAEFGLSEERSAEVAKMVYSWKKISNKRAMTDADADLFTQELLGTDIDSIKHAMKRKAEGEEADYQELLEQAAEVNETSPEHINTLVSELM